MKLFLLCLILTLDPGHVKRVVDGDTMDLYAATELGGVVRVRLLGFDAPECKRRSGINCLEWELGGKEAIDSLNVYLTRGPFEFKACNKDNFGRILALVERNGIPYTWKP